MLLVIDVGNTNTSLGIYEVGRLRASWRLTTRREQTADEWGVFIQTLLATRGIEQQHITGVAISNVVPPIQQALEWMCDRYFGVSPLTVEPGVTPDLPLDVDVPREVGADRVVSCVAGIALYGTPLIVVDFGTATRFDCVNTRGEFIGGAIAPGINTAADAAGDGGRREGRRHRWPGGPDARGGAVPAVRQPRPQARGPADALGARPSRRLGVNPG
jgi:type III pantothenate kinase